MSVRVNNCNNRPNMHSSLFPFGGSENLRAWRFIDDKTSTKKNHLVVGIQTESNTPVPFTYYTLQKKQNVFANSKIQN